MTPDELAKRHPKLFHITLPDAVENIRKHGLRSTDSLLSLFEISEQQKTLLLSQRRPQRVVIVHPIHGSAVITDNRPLSESALANCLDDGLTPSDWLRMLNQRVFFWPDESKVSNHLRARGNRGLKLAVLRFDTRRVVEAHLNATELSPINSGSTIHQPARRGLQTFTPVTACSFVEWQRKRGRRDTVKEVIVRDLLREIDNLVDEIVIHDGG